jgi:dUTP pyrophosphatase
MGVTNIPTGIAVEMPHNVWGMMVGRSSTIKRLGIQINTGILDTGYRGELYIVAINMNRIRVKIPAGERLAQLILLPNITVQTEIVEVDQLGESERGEKGFGSTGH